MRSAISLEMKIDVKLGSDHPSEFVDKKTNILGGNQETEMFFA
jgi:hypothetical protein